MSRESSHITINGQLTLAPNANATVIKVTNASNVTIDGSGLLMAIAKPKRLKPAASNSRARIGVSYGSNITIGSANSRLTIRNVFNWPVNIVVTMAQPCRI